MLAHASALSWQVGRSKRLLSGRTQLAPLGHQAAVGSVRGLRKNRSPQSSVSELAYCPLFCVLLAKASHKFGPDSMGGENKIYLFNRSPKAHSKEQRKREGWRILKQFLQSIYRRLNGFFGRSYAWDRLELKRMFVLLEETIFPLKAACVFLFKGIHTFQQRWDTKDQLIYEIIDEET